jgi:hypothetical protein
MAEFLAVAAIIAIAMWLGRDLSIVPAADLPPPPITDDAAIAEPQREVSSMAFVNRVERRDEDDKNSRFQVFAYETRGSSYLVGVRLHLSDTYMRIASTRSSHEAWQICDQLRRMER